MQDGGDDNEKLKGTHRISVLFALKQRLAKLLPAIAIEMVLDLPHARLLGDVAALRFIEVCLQLAEIRVVLHNPRFNVRFTLERALTLRFFFFNIAGL